MLLVRRYEADFAERVKENMDATGFSKVSKETLGVYGEGDGGEDGRGDGDNAGDGDVDGCLIAERSMVVVVVRLVS